MKNLSESQQPSPAYESSHTSNCNNVSLIMNNVATSNSWLCNFLCC